MSLDRDDPPPFRKPRPGPCPKCGSRRTVAMGNPNAPTGFEGTCSACGHDFPIPLRGAPAGQRK